MANNVYKLAQQPPKIKLNSSLRKTPFKSDMYTPDKHTQKRMRVASAHPGMLYV